MINKSQKTFDLGLTSKENTMLGIQAAIQAIPYVGSSIATLYFGYKQEIRFKRLEAFYLDLAKDIEKIKDIIKPILNHDKNALVAIIEEVNEKVENEYLKEKIQYFKNYFKSTLKNPVKKTNYDKRRYFLNVLASMTLLECEILNLLYNTSNSIKVMDINRIENINLIIGVIERLKSYGFLTAHTTKISFGRDNRKDEEVKINEFGREFCKFCIID